MAFACKRAASPKTASLWTALVSEDIKSAKILLEANMTRNSVLMSASALEKALKCYLLALGRLSDKDASHNTLALAEKCGFSKRAPKDVATAFCALKAVHVPVSYPSSKWVYDSISDAAYAATVYNMSVEAIKWVYGELMNLDKRRCEHGGRL